MGIGNGQSRGSPPSVRLYPDGYTWSSYWPEILALFAVNANLRSDSDVIVIDAAKKEQIQEIFWRMHSIEWEIDVKEISQPTPTPDPVTSITPDPPAPEYKYTLKITVSSRSVEELAAEMGFTADELSMIQQLLSDELRVYLLQLMIHLSSHILRSHSKNNLQFFKTSNTSNI